MKTSNKHYKIHSKVSECDSDFKVSGWGCRHQQCLILFICLTTAYSMRTCMGVALVVMVDDNVGTAAADNKYTFDSDNTSALVANGNGSNVTASENRGVLHSLLLVPPYPTFRWSKQTQDTVLSSFFWGYMLLQLPAGQLAHRFGAKYMLTAALFINCMASFCFPWGTFYGGWIFASALRMLQGLSQACIVPGMHTMLGRWTPLEERGRLAGWAYGGQALGAVLGLPITGFIASSALGWPGIFRFYGTLSGIVGCVIWTFGADSPALHTNISPAERQYIEEGLGHTGLNGKRKPPVPWCSILRSRGMWAIVVAHIGQTWGQLTLYTEVPAFMDKVMGVNIKANGMLTALPFLVMWFTNFFFTWFTDMLIVKKLLSVSNTRKLANSLGCVPAAVGLLALAYAPKNVYVVESLLVFICAFKIACSAGFHVNHIDISSNFSGTMMSISNFVSNLFGSLAPTVAGLILTDVTSEYLWRKVFLVAAGLFFFSNLVYVVFGTADKADWDNVLQEGDAEENPSEMKPMIDRKDTKKKQDMINVNS
ncbi:putative inorganic phosphate cotransporter [Bicyclus anynana]|uniref:Inorganic phosphate cotransporter n=1 Tax=Bicyclus anynana TaxID=110368 RepID=A0ABM3LR37_BICAN|nr:putative inorganic phosphate cotransporter [Bicyclus anynana]